MSASLATVRPTAAEVVNTKERVIRALEECQPLTAGQIRAEVPVPECVVNVALDRLQTDEYVVRRIIAGRIVYHLADWTQPKPGHRKPDAVEAAVSAAPADAAPQAAWPLTARRQRVLDVLADQARPLSSPELAVLLGRERLAVTTVLKELRSYGWGHTHGQGPGTRWSLSDAGRALTPAPMQAAAPESPPGLAHPAAQPIDAASSTAVPAARDTYTAVTEPAGPRNGLSSSADPALDATLNWHAAAAEAEAQRRNAAPAADYSLPESMSNTGEWEPEALAEPGASSLHIEDAKFAIWSDGRLEIDAGDIHMTLTQAATHRLFNFLDQFSSIEAH